MFSAEINSLWPVLLLSDRNETSTLMASESSFLVSTDVRVINIT